MKLTRILLAAARPIQIPIKRPTANITLRDRLQRVQDLIPPQPLLQSAYNSKFLPVNPETATQVLTRAVSTTSVDVYSVCKDFNITPRTLILLSIILLRSPRLPTHLQKLRLATAVSILASTTFTSKPDPLAAKELYRLLHGPTNKVKATNPDGQDNSIAAAVQAMIPPARVSELTSILRQIAVSDSDIQATKLYALNVLSSPSPSSREIAVSFLESMIPRLTAAIEAAEAESSKSKSTASMADLETKGKKPLGDIFTLLATALPAKEGAKKIAYLTKAANLFQNPDAYFDLALLCRPEKGEKHIPFSDLVPGYPAEEGQEGERVLFEGAVQDEKVAEKVVQPKKGKLTPTASTAGVPRKSDTGTKATPTPVSPQVKVVEKEQAAGGEAVEQEGTARATAYIRNLIKAAALGKKEAAGRIAGYYLGVGMVREAEEWATLALRGGVRILDVEGKEIPMQVHVEGQ